MKLIIDNHIWLSEFQPADKTALIEHLNEKDIYDRTLRIPFPYTEAHAEEWLAARLAQEHQTHWAIRWEDGHLIGAIGFEGLIEGHRAEIGYWLAKPYWNRGIMSAVVGRVCEWAFREWRLVKIAAHVFALNLASARVLEKCGFEQEGHLRKHMLKDGRFIDIKLYGLIR